MVGSEVGVGKFESCVLLTSNAFTCYATAY